MSHRYLECERRRASGAEPEPEPSRGQRARPPPGARPRRTPARAPAALPASCAAGSPGVRRRLPTPAPGRRQPSRLPRGGAGLSGGCHSGSSEPPAAVAQPPPLGTATMNPQCARCGKVVYPTEKVNCLDKVSQGAPGQPGPAGRRAAPAPRSFGIWDGGRGVGLCLLGSWHRVRARKGKRPQQYQDSTLGAGDVGAARVFVGVRAARVRGCAAQDARRSTAPGSLEPRLDLFPPPLLPLTAPHPRPKDLPAPTSPPPQRLPCRRRGK